MHCSDFVKRIAHRLDGSLPEHEVSLLEKHLSECGRCRAELLLQKKIQEALEEEVHSGLSINFTQRVTERALEVAQAKTRFRRWPYLIPAFALTAVTGVLFFLGTDLSQMFFSAIQPLAGAPAWVGNAMADALAGTGDLLAERASLLSRLPQPAVNSLLLTLLATLPAILGLYKVFAFLRE